MKEPRVHVIRNVAVVSNTGSGKTSLVEALLFASGAIPSLGSVQQGSTVSDFEPEEVHRRTSLGTSVVQFPHEGAVINLLDTPGALSLLNETSNGLRAVDGVVVVLSAAMGVRTELRRLWALVRELRLPCLIFVNELDKEETALPQALEEFQREFEVATLPLALPIGRGAALEGVVDVLRNVAVTSWPDRPKAQEGPIPAGMTGLAEAGQKQVAESVAELDDRLLEKYLTDGDLSEDELLQGLRRGVHQARLIPAYSGSAIRTIGVLPLLHAMVTLLPSPADRAACAPVQGARSRQEPESVRREASPTEPFAGLVFKTVIDPFMGRLSYVRVLSGTLTGDSGFLNATRQVKERGGHLYSIFGKKYSTVSEASAGDILAIGKLKDTLTGDTLCDDHAPIVMAALPTPRPVLSFAVEPKSKADIEKVSLGLHKLMEEDPSLEFVRNPETKEMVLSGMGQLHIDVALERLRRKYGADVTVHTPRVPYKETIQQMAQAQGKYKKQTGGHGQYGDCWLEVAPLGRGEGFRFENKIVGGAIPRNFIPAVEKGVVEAMHEGVLAGCPVVDLCVTVYDGSYHTVDSSEMAFKIAGSMGFRKAMENARPVLLEPMMSVEVESPEEHIGAVIGDLNARRGRIVSVTAQGHMETIKATVPLAEMLKYAPALNSITAGRGIYTMEFSHYDEVPRELAARIVDEQRAGRQAVAAH